MTSPFASSDCPYPIVSDSDLVAPVTSPSSTSVTCPDSAYGFGSNTSFGSFSGFSVGVSSFYILMLTSPPVSLASSSSLDDDARRKFILSSNTFFPVAILLHLPRSPASTLFPFAVLSRLSATSFFDRFSFVRQNGDKKCVVTQTLSWFSSLQRFLLIWNLMLLRIKMVESTSELKFFFNLENGVFV